MRPWRSSSRTNFRRRSRGSAQVFRRPSLTILEIVRGDAPATAGTRPKGMNPSGISSGALIIPALQDRWIAPFPNSSPTPISRLSPGGAYGSTRTSDLYRYYLSHPLPERSTIVDKFSCQGLWSKIYKKIGLVPWANRRRPPRRVPPAACIHASRWMHSDCPPAMGPKRLR